MQYRKEIDGLRALAIIPVLFFHAGFSTFSGGYVGVDVFFVISGYLITTLILAERETGRFIILRFYERRARRILPALIVVMAACVVPAWLWMTPEQLENFGQSLIAVSVFANNILLALTSDYFAPAADEKPLLHTWSLAVEEQYYVVFPVFVALCWPLGRRWLTGLIILAALVSLYAAEVGWRNDPQTNFYLPQARAWELLAGVLTAFALRYRFPDHSTGVPFGNMLSVLGISLILFAIFYFDEHTPFPSVFTLVPTLGTAVILYAAQQNTFIGRLLSRRQLVGIGLISYSLYLWHQPLLAFARIASRDKPGKPLLSVVIFAAVVLAYLSWRYIEKPFRNRGFLSGRIIFGLMLGCSALFVSLGLAAHLNHGFVSRMPRAYIVELAHFQQLSNERKEVQGPTCYLNATTIAKLGSLAKEWNCQTQPLPARVLVIGDSHANDKAMALRLNGVPADQILGPDCSLAPSRMQYKCRDKFDALFKGDIFSSYDLIVLANRWNDVREVILFENEVDYWKRVNVRLVLFGPMPEFGKFADRMSFLVGQGMSRSEAVGTVRYDEPKLTETAAALRAVADRNGLTYVDTANMFCHLSSTPCSPLSEEDSYLIVDYAHLSSAGAKGLGAQVTHDLGLE